MKEIFKELKTIHSDFKSEINSLSLKVLPKTKEIFEDFQSIFNHKTLIAIGLATVSSFASADQLPVEAIQRTFEESIKIQNIHYNPNLPTYFENKKEYQGQDTVFKNEFWQGNVATLIKNENIDEKYVDKKYNTEMKVINENRDDAFYINRIGNESTQEYINSLYTENKDDYLHYFRNHADHQNIFVRQFSFEAQPYLDDFVTYHEMAHASFEQQKSRMDKNNEINLNSNLREESHSDISALLMVAHKHNMNYDEFKKFTNEVIRARATLASEAGDTIHNSSIALTEFVRTLDKNPNIYENIAPEKISAFAAFFVNNVFEQDGKMLVSNINKLGIPTEVGGFLDALTEIRDKLVEMKKNGGSIFDTQIKMKGYQYYVGMLEEFYMKKNPEKMNEFIEAYQAGQYMKLGKMKIDMYDHFATMSDKDIQIYAVESARKVQKMDFEQYSTYMAQIVKADKIQLAHLTTAGEQIISENKEAVTKIIKNKI